MTTRRTREEQHVDNERMISAFARAMREEGKGPFDEMGLMGAAIVGWELESVAALQESREATWGEREIALQTLARPARQEFDTQAARGAAKSALRNERDPPFMGPLAPVKTRHVSAPIRHSLALLQQAALVKGVAIGLFVQHREVFSGHPSGSLTWQALDALEDRCVVEVVECIRSPLVKPHFPPAVHTRLAPLVGHQDKVGHPFLTDEEWGNKMRQFVAEKRQYEPRTAIAWGLAQAISAELVRERDPPLPDFNITLEMAHQLREIWMTCMKAESIPTIPDDEALTRLLKGCRDKHLEQCRQP